MPTGSRYVHLFETKSKSGKWKKSRRRPAVGVQQLAEQAANMNIWISSKVVILELYLLENIKVAAW